MGATHVLANIRRKCWPVKGMAQVSRVLRNCPKCRLLYSRPCEQLMAPLPSDRVRSGGFSFCIIGVDYFGPFRIVRGRSQVKRFGCLFTCFQTGAVHIEVAQSLTADSFIMAFMRLIGRRGSPEVVYSDNGSNFTGAESELKRHLSSLDQDKVSNSLSIYKIEWVFNPPGPVTGEASGKE